MERTSDERRAKNAAYQRAYRQKKRQNLRNAFRAQQEETQQTSQQQQEQQHQQLPQQQQEQQQQQQQQQEEQQQQQPQHQEEQQQFSQHLQPQLSQQLPYANFIEHSIAHQQFKKKKFDNKFGYTCAICDRLWFKNDMKTLPAVCHNIINENFDNFNFDNAKVCSTCYGHLKKNKIPAFSTSNGFKYPIRPVHLPDLDILTERLISPRLPFMAIRRLRHGQGQYGILGQIINVPVSVNNMVRALPRNLNDDFSINVHIKRKQIHKSSYMMGLVKKNVYTKATNEHKVKSKKKPEINFHKICLLRSRLQYFLPTNFKLASWFLEKIHRVNRVIDSSVLHLMPKCAEQHVSVLPTNFF